MTEGIPPQEILRLYVTASLLSQLVSTKASSWSPNHFRGKLAGIAIMISQIVRRVRISRASVFQFNWQNSPKLWQSRMASTFPDLPIFRAISSHDPQSTAVIHSKSKRRFLYGELLKDVEKAISKLHMQLKSASTDPIGGQRVAFLVENGYDYVGAHFEDSLSEKSLY